MQRLDGHIWKNIRYINALLPANRRRSFILPGVCLVGTGAFVWWRFTQLEDDRNNDKQEKDRLQRLLQQTEEQLKQNEKEKDLLQQTLQQSEEKVKQNEKEKDRLQQLLKRSEEQFEQTEIDRKNLQRKHNNLLQEVGRQLAADIAKDETKTENISQSCRPSTIKEKYYSMYFQDASHLKDKVLVKPDDFTEEFWSLFVRGSTFHLFKAAGEIMSRQHKSMFDMLSLLYRQPVLAGTKTLQDCTNMEALPEDITDRIRSYTRENQGKVIFDEVLKAVAEEAFTDFQGFLEVRGCTGSRVREECDKLIQITANEMDHNLSKFLRDVCHITWQMALQQPPMFLNSSGIDELVDEELQQVLPSRNMDWSRYETLVVDFYLEPSLMHGSAVLQKGRVVLRDPEQPRAPTQVLIDACVKTEEVEDIQEKLTEGKLTNEVTHTEPRVFTEQDVPNEVTHIETVASTEQAEQAILNEVPTNTEPVASTGQAILDEPVSQDDATQGNEPYLKDDKMNDVSTQKELTTQDDLSRDNKIEQTRNEQQDNNDSNGPNIMDIKRDIIMENTIIPEVIQEEDILKVPTRENMSLDSNYSQSGDLVEDIESDNTQNGNKQDKNLKDKNTKQDENTQDEDTQCKNTQFENMRFENRATQDENTQDGNSQVSEELTKELTAKVVVEQNEVGDVTDYVLVDSEKQVNQLSQIGNNNIKD